MTNKQLNETKPKTSGLSVQRTVVNKMLDVNVQQTWRFGIPEKPIMIEGKPFNQVSYLYFNFDNIPHEECYECFDYAMMPVPSKKMFYKSDSDNDLYHFAIECQDFNNMRQKGTKQVHFALDYFKKKGYTIPSYEVLFKNVVTPEEYLKVEKKSEEKWVELLSDLGNAETQALVKNYIQRFGKIFTQVYGHQLTFRNAKLILSQKPDATLVMTANYWRKYFNCVVNPDAQRILYIGRQSNVANKSMDDVQRYADTHGIMFDKNKAEYRGHATYGIKVDDAESWATCLVVGYDSSDVTPIDENDDWRETRFGMKNNLTGEPNGITTAYYEKYNQENSENSEEYKKIMDIVNNNARYAFEITLYVIKNSLNDEQAVNRLRKKAEQNVPFKQLITEAIGIIVSFKLDRDYKIHRDVNRAKGEKFITGLVLYSIGVWNEKALSAIGGEKIDRDSLVHYSNILNEVLTMYENAQNKQLENMKQAVKDINQPEPEQDTPQQLQQVAETTVHTSLNEMRLTSVTPQQFASLLNLKVVDNEPNETNNMVEEELLTEYYDKKLTVDDFTNPKNKKWSHISHEEYINGFPVVYQITDRQNVDSIFRNGFDREFTGAKAGNVYGPGIYTTYDFNSTKKNLNKREYYGDTIIKMVVLSKFKNFLIFDASVAKKVYGKDWHISSQLKNLFSEKQCEEWKRNGTWKYITSRDEFTSGRALSIWKNIGDEQLISKGVAGFIFRGEYNGNVCVIRDFKSILPIAYSTDEGHTWNYDKFTQDTIDTVSYDVDNRTFIGKDIDKYKNTEKVSTALNKRINDYILMQTNDGKYNYIDIKKHPLSPINFDAASPFRENGMAYVEIRDPKYTDILNGEFHGYVSKKGIHGTQNMEDYTSWNQFRKFLKQTGVLNEEYRVRWCITNSSNDWTTNVISEGTLLCGTIEEAQNCLCKVLTETKGKQIEHASIERKNKNTGLFEYVIRTKKRG